jgi:predicted amidophosphoribosyltransferase
MADVVWSCPDCQADLDDHGDVFTCPGCGGAFTEAAVLAMYMTDDDERIV